MTSMYSNTPQPFLPSYAITLVLFYTCAICALITHLNVLLLVIMFMCIYLRTSVYTPEMLGAPRTGITESFESPNMGTGN